VNVVSPSSCDGEIVGVAVHWRTTFVARPPGGLCDVELDLPVLFEVRPANVVHVEAYVVVPREQSKTRRNRYVRGVRTR